MEKGQWYQCIQEGTTGNKGLLRGHMKTHYCRIPFHIYERNVHGGIKQQGDNAQTIYMLYHQIVLLLTRNCNIQLSYCPKDHQGHHQKSQSIVKSINSSLHVDGKTAFKYLIEHKEVKLMPKQNLLLLLLLLTSVHCTLQTTK